MHFQAIQKKIFEIRGQQVMLDYDLAALYEVETRVFNQAVKRNLESFPEDFMFRLTKDEWQLISSSQIVMSVQNDKMNSSQFVMSSRKHRGASYLPYAFTEHGVTVLASVLKSSTARKMNIAIVHAFITLRKYAIQYKDILEQLNGLREKIGGHDAQLN